MVPRNEVYGIDLDDSDEDILRSLQTSAHTRLPVWREDINNIVGVLHMRNISRVLDQQGLDRAALEREMEKPYFIPESTPLHTQLLNFQKKNSRLGVVVDEYGEVMGLVALEDILEEIVGEFTSNLADSRQDISPARWQLHHSLARPTIRDINQGTELGLAHRRPQDAERLILEYLESFPDANAGMAIRQYRAGNTRACRAMWCRPARVHVGRTV